MHRLLVAAGVAVAAAVVATGRDGASDRVRGLRARLDALVTTLRPTLSIAWFPLVIPLFQLTETVILLRDAVRMRFRRGRHVKR